MKNTLTDLNNHLFAQLERLGDEELNGEALNSEIQRAAAIVSVGEAIVHNANTQLQAAKLMSEAYGGSTLAAQLPTLGLKPEKLNG